MKAVIKFSGRLLGSKNDFQSFSIFTNFERAPYTDDVENAIKKAGFELQSGPDHPSLVSVHLVEPGDHETRSIRESAILAMLEAIDAIANNEEGRSAYARDRIKYALYQATKLASVENFAP
jgi:hypothetical protein